MYFCGTFNRGFFWDKISPKWFSSGSEVPKDESKASASLFDPEGAARDASLLHDLEKKLGIAGNSKRRRKEEKQIFQDLFEEEDLGIEELPSSDENETAQPSSLEGLKESDIVGLLDTILGQGEMTSTSSIKTQGSKSKKRKSWDDIVKCHP